MFSREKLQEIRRQAYAYADTRGLNPSWKRLLLELGDTADRLDAYIARTEVSKKEDLPNEEEIFVILENLQAEGKGINEFAKAIAKRIKEGK